MGGDTLEVDIDYIAIGKRIRSARLAKKMTQETLSNMIDVYTDLYQYHRKWTYQAEPFYLLSIAQIP